MNKSIHLLIATLFTIFTVSASAVPLQSFAKSYQNTNGTSFTATASGDEYMVTLRADDGTLVVYDKDSGNYMVAEYDKNNNRLVPSNINYPFINQLNPGLISLVTTNQQKGVSDQDLAKIWQAEYDLLNKPAFID